VILPDAPFETGSQACSGSTQLGGASASASRRRAWRLGTLGCSKGLGKPARPARERSDGWDSLVRRTIQIYHDCPSVAMVDAFSSASVHLPPDREGQLAGKRERGVCLTCSLAAQHPLLRSPCCRPDLQSYHFRPFPSLSKLSKLPRLPYYIFRRSDIRLASLLLVSWPDYYHHNGPTVRGVVDYRVIEEARAPPSLPSAVWGTRHDPLFYFIRLHGSLRAG